MAMGMYRGVNGVARKCRKIYRGVNGVARKVRKGYRGVNSVARQFFVSGIDIYHYGNECTEITGGYEIKTGQTAMLPSGSGFDGGATMNKNSDNLQISIPNDYKNRIGMFHTKNKIDLTNYTKIGILIDFTTGNTSYSGDLPRYALFCATDNLYLSGTKFLASNRHNNTDGSVSQKIIEVDVSAITGSHYIAFFLARDTAYGSIAYNMDLKIHSAWLEY